MDAEFRTLRLYLDRVAIPFYGTADSHRLENEPVGYRPSDLLADARSLLCLGIPVPKGVLRCGGRSESTYWRTASVVYRFLDAVLVRCAAILESAGETAVPVFGCFPYDVKGKGDFWGYLNLVKAAETAGLGKQGKNGLLVNPRVGSRLLLGGIVTTAVLPSWRPQGKTEGCPDNCSACQDACPVKAIDDQGRVDRLKCVRHSMKSPLFIHLVKSGEVADSDVSLINHISAVDDHSMYTCIACVAACPYGSDLPFPLPKGGALG